MIKSINLCLVLGLVALPMASAFVVLPSTAVAKAECGCSNLKTLQAEVRNAIRLQAAFRNKINELRAMAKGASTIALKQFAEGDARRGLEPIPGNKGPSEVDYIPWGRDLYDAAGTKYGAEKLCNMSPSSIAVLELAIASAECPGIGEALRAHEKVHNNFCQRIGFFPYEEMHAADRAQEEAEAYGAQIKVLQDIIAKLRCGYRASGHSGELDFSGVICDLEKPFTVSGSVINYQFQFTPSSPTAGTVKITAAGMSVTELGGGTYTIEGADTENPKIAVTGSVVGRTQGFSRSTGGTFYIDLTPLKTNECGDNQ
jgi:hypothetical protein